jgi:hypothetical protein
MPRADLLKSGHWRAVYLETRQHGSAGGRWKRTQPVTSHCSRIEVRPQNQTTWLTEQMWQLLRVIVGC